MKNFNPACVAVMLTTMAPSSQALATEPEIGWIALRCAAYQGGYCRVPFTVALGNPTELSKLPGGVQLRGYLVKESQGYALYEDRDSAQRGWRSDAILIQFPKASEIAKSLERRNQSLVILRGSLQLAVNEGDEYWVQLSVHSPATIAPVVGEELKR
jgi:hypothetical protein